MTLSLGFSPCPNDCFMFDAIVHRRIDLEGLEFDVRMADIEALNAAAFAGEADVTKLSFHAYAYCIGNYVLLDAGQRARPELRSAADLEAGDLAATRSRAAGLKIAIPGKYTTANFLLALAFPARDRQDRAAVLRDRRRRCSTGRSTPGSSFTRTGSPTRRRASRRSSTSASSGKLKPAPRFRSAASSSIARCRRTCSRR